MESHLPNQIWKPKGSNCKAPTIDILGTISFSDLTSGSELSRYRASYLTPTTGSGKHGNGKQVSFQTRILW